MARLKPVPKLILIVGVVGAVGYGINFALEQKKTQAPEIIQQTTAPAVEPQQVQIQVVQAPAATPEVATPQTFTPTQGTQTDAGLAKLLQAKK